VILFIGVGPEFFPIAYRLRLMGHDVLVYSRDPDFSRSYDNLLMHIPQKHLLEGVVKADAVIVDNVRLAEDLGLPRLDSCVGVSTFMETDEMPDHDFVTGWWTGSRFSAFTHTYQEHGVLSGNVGPLGGGSHVGAMIPIDNDELLQTQVERLKDLKYAGPVVRRKETYYLGHPWDSTYATLALVRGPRDRFWLNRFNNASLFNGIAAWVRVTLPPYPFHAPEILKEFKRPVKKRLSDLPYFWARDIALNETGLITGCCDGFVGVVTASGRDTYGVFASMKRNLRKLQEVAGELNYRNDYKDVIKELINARHYRQ